MFVFKTCHKNQSAIEKLSGKWKIKITLRSSKVGARLSRYPRSVENGIGISVREGLNPLPLRVLASTSMALRLVSWRPLFNLAGFIFIPLSRAAWLRAVHPHSASEMPYTRGQLPKGITGRVSTQFSFRLY